MQVEGKDCFAFGCYFVFVLLLVIIFVFVFLFCFINDSFRIISQVLPFLNNSTTIWAEAPSLPKLEELHLILGASALEMPTYVTIMCKVPSLKRLKISNHLKRYGSTMFGGTSTLSNSLFGSSASASSFSLPSSETKEEEEGPSKEKGT